jgi:hypothetical protein
MGVLFISPMCYPVIKDNGPYKCTVRTETILLFNRSCSREPLSKTILQYINHPESKYEGDIGQLERRHIHVSEIVHIGKEANNIEEELLETGKVQVFRNKEKEREKIIQIRQCDAEKLGINRGTRWRMKK